MHDHIEDLNRLAREAGNIIMTHYAGDVEVTRKDDDSPVTAADLAANAHIVEGLIRLEPDIPIVSEEEDLPSPSSLGDRFWLVDPLDGTKSFIKKTGEFTVNIALVEFGVPTVGVIYVPAQDILYYTASPSKLYREKDGITEPIKARRADEEAGLVVVASASHRTADTDAFIDTLPKVQSLVSTSSSLKLCLVAEGAADVYPRFGPTCEWDIAAGHAILNAGGGELVTEHGEPFAYAKPDYLNGYFVAWGDRSR